MVRQRLQLTRALAHRNYRLFFSGQSVSLIGTWITRIATSWLVYRLTGSELLLGIVGFCGQIPMLLLSSIAGVLVDRWDRRRMLVVTQVASMVQSIALAVLTLTNVITVGEIIVLQICQGIVNAFDTPARQAFVVQMVEDRNDLPNAIALNSSMVNGSRIIGPSIGGLLIAGVGEGWCFALDAVSYLAVIGSLLAMRVARTGHRTHETNMFEELHSGFRYVMGSAPIRTSLTLLAIVSMMGMPYTVLMPAVAVDVLHGNANTLGFLMTATGVGALAGALYLASRSSVVGLGRVILVATAAFGAGLVAFALSRTLWVSLAILPIVGGGFMMQLAATNTVLQTLVEERYRGRVMAFYAMAVLGTAPIGSLIAGIVASRIGAPWTIGAGGVICLATAVWFLRQLPMLRRLIRPIYIERGILPVPAVDTGTKSL